MLQKKTVALLICMVVAILLVAGCYKNKTLTVAPAAVTRPVTFSGDIIPIFNKSCNMSGCHTTGGQTPNLSPSSAYNSLINGNYVNKSEPENSILYKKVSGTLGNPMPPSGVVQDYPPLILAWIQQGANNN